jgi:iron complex outermembrane receptor protein
VAEDTATASHLVLGFRGNVKGYDYDVAYTHNSSDVTERALSGYQNQTALVSLLSNNNAFNPLSQYQSAGTGGARSTAPTTSVRS